jgi:excisionase family DNA binding protein
MIASARKNVGVVVWNPPDTHVGRSFMNTDKTQSGARAEPRVLSIREFSQLYGVGRTKVYDELKSGRLRGRKVGNRTIIARDDAENWLQQLPIKLTCAGTN